MHRPLSAAVLALSLIALGGFAAAAATTDVNVEIVTSAGTMEVALDPVRAPNTTKNFLRLVDAKFYDGGTFFRAVPGFVIQGGNRPREKDDDPSIKLEAPVNTGVHNLNGTIAMARTPRSGFREVGVLSRRRRSGASRRHRRAVGLCRLRARDEERRTHREDRAHARRGAGAARSRQDHSHPARSVSS